MIEPGPQPIYQYLARCLFLIYRAQLNHYQSVLENSVYIFRFSTNYREHFDLMVCMYRLCPTLLADSSPPDEQA
jgi:hypothetical protein